ncbi:long-chain fatty acid--CoA ligase [Geothermobacter hydrogeniphilus]|uniref:Long-chain fatty acid--CoA ligase n=1 Tax=Geothermobacter hydrogeniphilus TaxID=1969733 RepID=A0A1X0Y608_9BACT|nr:long-chain fatty acid--CoA ligase [Geothermobacter hydrogeniphilus]ORJ60573.1 long-chain fatty acid--CoA ligase [Geothermobacter hydrogeniphilus]
MKATMMNAPLTLGHILERAGTLFAATEIVSRMPDRSLHRCTYGDFYRRARQLAEALSAAGLKRGERVGTLMWSHYAHLEAYFGIPVAGGVLHTLNLRLSPEEIAYIVNHAEDRFLIVDDVLLPLLEKFRGQIDVERIFVVPLTGQAVPAGYESYEELLSTASGHFTPPEMEENEPCGMCYTSGTTGRPKGVVYSHRSSVLHSLVTALPDLMNLSCSKTVLPVVPMFHANAWGIPYAATNVGARQVFPGPHLDAESLLDLFAGEQVTQTAGVPTIWLSILETLQRNPGRWQLIPGMEMIVGGSAPPESMIRAFAELGLEVIHAWGMTETSPVASFSRLKPHLEKESAEERFAYRAKQGMPVPLVDLRIAGEKGPVAWDGRSVGEIQVRGPWITAGYHTQPATEERFTADGWLRTGDVGHCDPEGYVQLTDRTKDLIKSGGEWISSVALENAIMGHPAVREAAVIAVPHPKWGERPLAVVALKDGTAVDGEAICSHLAESFPRWQLPDGCVFVESIPRTSTGKFFKARLREQYADWGSVP